MAKRKNTAIEINDFQFEETIPSVTEEPSYNSTVSNGGATNYSSEYNAYEGATDVTIVGVGLYTTKYKILVSLLMIGIAAAVGGLITGLSYLLASSGLMNCFYMDYVAPFIPAFNVVVMLVYYIFAVRPYNYVKNGAVTQIPTTENRTYRQLHSMYYTTKRAILVVVLLAVLNVTLFVSSNFVYGWLIHG